MAPVRSGGLIAVLALAGATVRNTESRIRGRVSKGTVRIAGRRRHVGFYSGIACKGPKRTIQATFTSEHGDRNVARTQIKRC